MFKKIVSGGQTGADRAALDAAIKNGIQHGGWIPKGRLSEDGPLSSHYGLAEMPNDSFPKRTEQNVIDSDGTLIISHGKLTGGSEFTRKMAKKHGKPWLHVNMDRTDHTCAASTISEWAAENHIEVLNVAGPRASKDPSIYSDVMEILDALFQPKSAQT